MRTSLLARSLVFALALLPLVATRASAQTALEGETEIARDALVVVFAENAQLDPDKAKKLIQRVKAAYDFVKEEQHWAPNEILSHALGVHVLTEQHMKEKHKNVVGIANGPHSFLIGEGFLDREMSDRTLAHELTHIQDRRHMPPKLGLGLPHYLLEGRAISMGIAWCTKQQISLAKYNAIVTKHTAALSGETARKALRDDPMKSISKMESGFKRDMEEIGYFFVEWLRTRQGGTGIADIEVRLARVVEAVAGGATVEDAFEKEVGVKLVAVQDAFIAHMKATEGKPAERFKGTALEPYATDAKPTTPAGPKPAASPVPDGAPAPKADPDDP